MKMQSPRTSLSSLAIMAIIALIVWSKADAEKYVSCCTAVSNEEVTEPIIGIKFQRPSNHCVTAMILTTDKNESFCCPPFSPWVINKVKEFRNNLKKMASTASTLLVRLPSTTPSTAFSTNHSPTEGSAQGLTPID